MTIDKSGLDSSLRRVRGLYRLHASGQLSPSGFATRARAELNTLYMDHTKRLIGATADRVTSELQSLQRQFALDLDCHLSLHSVARGYRGIRASMHLRNRGTYSGLAQIFIGPFDEWDKIAIHTSKEREAYGRRASLYTKTRNNRWQEINDFDFASLLQRIKEESERPEPGEDKIPF